MTLADCCGLWILDVQLIISDSVQLHLQNQGIIVLDMVFEHTTVVILCFFVVLLLFDGNHDGKGWIL